MVIISLSVKNIEIATFTLIEKRNLYKLFILDTGLLACLSLKSLQFQVLNGDIAINEGALTENYVASELAKKGIGLNYYDKKSKQELDFVFPEEGRISIIEVKSGNDYKRHASLDAVRREHPTHIHRSIVLSKFNVSKEGDVILSTIYDYVPVSGVWSIILNQLTCK